MHALREPVGGRGSAVTRRSRSLTCLRRIPARAFSQAVAVSTALLFARY